MKKETKVKNYYDTKRKRWIDFILGFVVFPFLLYLFNWLLFSMESKFGFRLINNIAGYLNLILFFSLIALTAKKRKYILYGTLSLCVALPLLMFGACFLGM